MNEYEHLRFLKDNDSELSEELNTFESPLFDNLQDENLPNVFLERSEESVDESTNEDATVDVSRFPEVDSEDIEDLRSSALNINTSRSTKQWMNVFNSWCIARRFQNVNIETMATLDLDKVLCKFYAEVKKKDGEDYEPESLRIMQCAIERYLKENGYEFSILRSREFRKSQEILNAKAISLRREGKGKRPNKAQCLEPEEESALWEKGQLGDFNARVLTNINFKNLSEQLGFRGRQEHYDSYVEDFVVRPQQDGSEAVEFREGPTKTRSGGLRIRRRSTPQLMFSTDGSDKDPVRLFKLWLSKRPEGMKDNGPLYLSIINRPKSSEVWYTKVRMGQNTIGNIVKSMASCLNTNKKLTNHSMRKTLVSKLKKSGQARNVICEITGHSRESSLDDYDQIDQNQRRDLSHIISGFRGSKGSSEMSTSTRSVQRDSNVSTNTFGFTNRPASSSTAVNAPLIQHQNLERHQPIVYNHGNIQPNAFPIPPQYQMAAFNRWDSTSTMPISSYTGCTFNNYFQKPPSPKSPRKKRRVLMFDSDDEE